MFEDDEDRALAFAEAAASEPLRRLTARPIASPAVVGCVFGVQRWLDMTTRAGCLESENAHLQFQAGYLLSGMRSPLNLPANSGDEEILPRGLDRWLFQFIHATCRRRHWHEGYQAARGAFQQGPEVAPNSGFHRDGHAQIALRYMSCIKGWFLPPGARQLERTAKRRASRTSRNARSFSPGASPSRGQLNATQNVARKPRHANRDKHILGRRLAPAGCWHARVASITPVCTGLHSYPSAAGSLK